MAKRGRKTLFKSDIIKESEIMAGYGLTEAQIAHVFHVSPFTLSRWKRRHPEFNQALKRGETVANHEVVKSLYKRAIGYFYDEIHYEKSKTGGLGVRLTEAEIETIKSADTFKTKVITKMVIPDTIAQIFWLKNKDRANWRDKQDIEHSGEIKYTKMGEVTVEIVAPDGTKNRFPLVPQIGQN